MSVSYALLIGIDEYSALYPDYQLKGCVNDARLIKSLLLNNFGFKEGDVTELYNADASQAAFLAAMADLVEKTAGDDRVYFHYSGHGSYRKCLDGSEGTGYDSTIMPADSGREPKPNLDIADDDIGQWLEKLSTRSDNLTLVFDCCHSGTITRDPFGGTTRAVPGDERSLAELGLSPRAKSEAGRSAPSGVFLPRSDRYVVISGCRDDESSNEYTLDMDGTPTRHGALTYWLTQALLGARSGTTYRDVFEQAYQQVTSIYSDQHPQIEGRRDRLLFGTDIVEPLKYITISSVTGTSAILNGGVAHGIELESSWAVYPAGTNSTEGQVPLATLTVTSVAPISAQAEMSEASSDITAGCRCVMNSSHTRIAPLSVDTSALEGELKTSMNESIAASPLLRVAETLETAELRIAAAGPNWLALAKDGRAATPPHPLIEATERTRLLGNLETRAQARNVLALSNPDSKLDVDFHLYRSTDGKNWDTVEENTHFTEGDRVAFELINNEKRQVYLNLMDIGLSGKVALFYPGNASGELIDPQQTLKVGFDDLELELGIPEGHGADSGRETFKAIVSTSGADFTWLQQAGTRSVGPPEDPLQQMMALACGGSNTRELRVKKKAPADDWQAINWSIELHRAQEEEDGP